MLRTKQIFSIIERIGAAASERTMGVQPFFLPFSFLREGVDRVVSFFFFFFSPPSSFRKGRKKKTGPPSSP